MATRAETGGVSYDDIYQCDVHAMPLRRIVTEEDVTRAVILFTASQAKATTGAPRCQRRTAVHLNFRHLAVAR